MNCAVIPESLQQLARFIVRGFYTIEDVLIVDMLLRYPCMKEDDICELLKLEKKQTRARIAVLKNDKFIQIRLKMETGPDGKAQKVNYYFINFKTFVNVVKYKLDLMRKRLETEERDATSRASFKCQSCNKTFTDLEADQLFDFATGEFRCTFCGSPVEEDMSAVPKKDSRLMLAKFNEQLQPLYDLLRQMENIVLTQELLDPEPVDIDQIRGLHRPQNKEDNQHWSGEATRRQGFSAEDTRVDVSIGESDVPDTTVSRKARPIWMTESTVMNNEEPINNTDLILEQAAQASSQAPVVSIPTNNSRNKKENEDIMSVLLQHEKRIENTNSSLTKGLKLDSNPGYSSESSEDEKDIENVQIPQVEFLNSDSEEDDDIPTVYVAGRSYPVDEINDELIVKMTQQEKDNYIQVYQEHYSHMYD